MSAQDFEPALSAYSDRGAADFRTSTPCTISQVDVVGTWAAGGGPATSVSVEIRNGGTVPGATNLANPVLDNNITATGQSGSNFNTVLPGPVTLNTPGHYWLVFHVKMHSSVGQWDWVMSAPGMGNADQWRNVGGGWACGTSWQFPNACFGVQAKSFIFTLL